MNFSEDRGSGFFPSVAFGFLCGNSLVAETICRVLGVSAGSDGDGDGKRGRGTDGSLGDNPPSLRPPTCLWRLVEGRGTGT